MYTLTEPSGILRKDGVEIVRDDSLPAYREYAAWLAAGNGPVIVQDAPPRQRIEVSAWQIRKALNQRGLRDQLEAWVAASDNRDLRDGYEFAPTFWSDHAFAQAAGAALGLNADQMYEFFELAKSL